MIPDQIPDQSDQQPAKTRKVVLDVTIRLSADVEVDATLSDDEVHEQLVYRHGRGADVHAAVVDIRTLSEYVLSLDSPFYIEEVEVDVTDADADDDTPESVE